MPGLQQPPLHSELIGNTFELLFSMVWPPCKSTLVGSSAFFSFSYLRFTQWCGLPVNLLQSLYPPLLLSSIVNWLSPRSLGFSVSQTRTVRFTLLSYSQWRGFAISPLWPVYRLYMILTIVNWLSPRSLGFSVNQTRTARFTLCLILSGAASL